MINVLGVGVRNLLLENDDLGFRLNLARVFAKLHWLNMTSLGCLGRAPFKLPRICDRDQRAGRGCSQPIAGK